MCDDSRVRPRGRVLLVTAVFVLAGGATWLLTADEPRPEPRIVADDPADPASPRFEPSEVIRDTFVSTAEPYTDERNSCPVWLTDLGTEAAIGDVVAMYEAIGFEVMGRPGTVDEAGNWDPNGELIRWIGERGTGKDRWRRVDISTGAVAGRPEWATVVELYAAACDR